MNKSTWEKFHELNATVLRVNPARPLEFMSKWVKQNGADAADVVEGVLLDNVLFSGRRGWAAFYETYVNPNQSTYTIVFIKNSIDRPDPLAALFWDTWEALKDE